MSSNTWEPKTGEWVQLRYAREQPRKDHVQVTKRTPTQVHVGTGDNSRIYRRRVSTLSGEVTWRCAATYPVTYLMPSTRPQAELQAEWMAELRAQERQRMRRECEAAVLTAYERGDDDAIRRAIHELEKGTKP